MRLYIQNERWTKYGRPSSGNFAAAGAAATCRSGASGRVSGTAQEASLDLEIHLAHLKYSCRAQGLGGFANCWDCWLGRQVSSLKRCRGASIAGRAASRTEEADNPLLRLAL
jgi:hypothetical protein